MLLVVITASLYHNILLHYATEAQMDFTPFLSCVFLCYWNEFRTYILKWVLWIMLPFQMLINNNNGGLGAWPQSKFKFILSQPSLYTPRS